MRLLLLPLLLLLPVAAHPQAPAWRAVTVGDDHACALDRAGRAYCWGNNHSGQLGARTAVKCGIIGESGGRGCYPTANERPQPAGGGMRFAAVSAGRYLTCGIDAEGRAFCWGEPMGDTAAYRDRCLRERACSFAPVPLVPTRRFTSIDAHARCAATREGEALCWGHRFDDAGRSSTPWQAPVLLVAGDPRWMSAATPTYCALGHDGRAWCRGDAAFGVLGNGGRDSAAAGRPVESPMRFSGLAVLGTWVCGMDVENTARCWGAPGYADAGPNQAREGFEVCERWGSRTWCNLHPAPVAYEGRFLSVTAMPRGTMPVVAEMVALTADGEAYAWGGDRVARPWHPDQRWNSLSAGDWGQCGVTTGGELFCWGRDPHDEVQGLIPHP